MHTAFSIKNRHIFGVMRQARQFPPGHAYHAPGMERVKKGNDHIEHRFIVRAGRIVIRSIGGRFGRLIFRAGDTKIKQGLVNINPG